MGYNYCIKKGGAKMEETIIINMNDGKYYLPSKGGWYPLPYGVFKVEGALVKGRPFASRGGRWYYKLPDFSVIGYGRYCPYREFSFSGEIIVSKYEENYDCWMWRQSLDKWIYLKGEAKMSMRKKIEMTVKCQLEDKKLDFVGEQGKLKVFKTNINLIHNDNVEEFDSKILHDENMNNKRGFYPFFNHQVFFSDVTDEFAHVILERNDIIKVGLIPHPHYDYDRVIVISIVSPDHFYQPLMVETKWGEIVILEHPRGGAD